MFNIKSIEVSPYDPTKIIVKGKAISSSDSLSYDNGGLEAYFDAIPEVEKAEVIGYNNHPGGGSTYSVALTPIEDLTVEQLIEAVPGYTPVDKDGNKDSSEMPTEFKNLNIFDDGKGAEGRNRVEWYNQSV